MGINVKAGDAAAALEPFSRLSGKTLPARAAFSVARAFAVLRAHPDVIATESARQAAVRKYGVEADGNVSVQPENAAAFTEEYLPIASALIELDVKKLPASIWDSVPDMSVSDALALMPFCEEE